jgi:hypothetical protein
MEVPEIPVFLAPKVWPPHCNFNSYRMKRVTVLIILASAFAATGCSGTRVEGTDTSQSQFQTQAPPPLSGGTGFSGSSSGSSGSSSTSGSSSSGSSGSGVPPITMRVGTVGYNSVTVEIDTRSVLKVQFAPGIQDEVVAGTGYAPAYGHLGVYIQVGTTTQPTPMLSNGLLDNNPQKSPVLDFSNAFTKSCDPTDLTCHQPVQIMIFKPNNDYFCMNFGMYCPWAQMYQTHPWHGELSIQTDDTDAL